MDIKIIRIQSGTKKTASLFALLALAVVGTITSQAQSGPKFYNDDPLAREPETQDASKTQSWDIGLIADLTYGLFAVPRQVITSTRAQNVNTIDEVPDSSWFTNRIYATPISAEEITRGPNTIAGPAPGRWTIIRPKTAGTAPGFVVRDEKGEIWFLSFDPRSSPVASTAAIAVSTRLFWAMGYHQVESYLTTVRPENLVIGDKVTIPSHGRRRRLVMADVKDVFKRSAKNSDGSYRVMAGRGLPGRVIGGFKYHGTRPDDPNDIVPHEHRRELRAFQVFGAWTNLVDLKAGNTLDSIITEGGRSTVRHYLQDVGSTFGTGSKGPRGGDEGHEYLYDGDKLAKRLFTGGLYIQKWQTVDYVKNDEIGLFTAEGFEPEKWVPRVPASALLWAREDDTLWAALRVMAFTDDLIRAAVKTGEYTDPAAEKLLTDVLIQRRDKIGRVYFAKINPLVRFALDAGALTFENPAVRTRVGDAPKGGYQAVWSRFDNATRATQPIGSPTTSRDERLQAPADLPTADGGYIKVAVSAIDSPNPAWAKPVDVYFRRTGGSWKLVGIDRLPEAPAAPAKK